MKKGRDTSVVGVGMSQFGRFPDRTFMDLGQEAVNEALNNANMNFEDIEIAYCAHTNQGEAAGQRVLAGVGLTGIPIINIENACASGSTAFREAVFAVASGFYDVAIAIGVEKMAKGALDASAAIGGKAMEKGKKAPPVMPMMFAQITKAHMKKYGTTVEQLAKVGAKNHNFAAMNPKAQYKIPCSSEDVLNSRMISKPLTLYMCCPTGDGAAAAIVCSSDIAKKFTSKPIRVAGSALASNLAGPGILHPVTEVNARGIRLAYESADIGPEDLDLAEVHDCFSIAEIIHYENMGLCKSGEGGKIIDEGLTELGGECPISVSGGLLAKGHPVGATGLSQIFEVVTQLRGEGGERQVKGAKMGLTHCQGFGGAVGVHILEK